MSISVNPECLKNCPRIKRTEFSALAATGIGAIFPPVDIFSRIKAVE